ncbi:hypothetical protein ACWEQL_25445 [Kitasatospora sp. NPDC004240]
MDDYRLPAAYGLIRDFLVAQHFQAMQAEAERQAWLAQVRRLRRLWIRTARRGFVHLACGVAALLYLNDGGTWTTAMTVGACLTGFLVLLWILWAGQADPDHEQGPVTVIRLLAGVAHIAVLVWGWTAYGAATAIPWLFVESGILGIVSGLLQSRKLALLL